MRVLSKTFSQKQRKYVYCQKRLNLKKHNACFVQNVLTKTEEICILSKTFLKKPKNVGI